MSQKEQNTGDFSPVYLTREDMAWVLGVTDRHFSRFGFEPDHKVGKLNYYDARACVQWRIDQSIASAVGSGTADLNEERARKTKLEADRIELIIKKMSANLLEAEFVQNVWADDIARARARLLAIPSRLAPVLPGDTIEIEKTIQKYIYEALDELKNHEPEEYIADSQEIFDEGQDSMGSSTESDN